MTLEKFILDPIQSPKVESGSMDRYVKFVTFYTHRFNNDDTFNSIPNLKFKLELYIQWNGSERIDRLEC